MVNQKLPIALVNQILNFSIRFLHFSNLLDYFLNNFENDFQVLFSFNFEAEADY